MTCVLTGLEGHQVVVETDLSRGLPAFNIVGLPDTAIKESKERVRTAIKNSDYEFPLNRITVNLAPAHIKKEGSQIDLAIAIGILCSNGELEQQEIDDIIFLGELSLDGRIQSVQGALPMIISMREVGYKTCIVPYDNKDECALIKDMNIIPVSTLTEAVEHLKKKNIIPPHIYSLDKGFDKDYAFDIDFSDIKGQHALIRALEISAAGFHNLLVIGPPGSGKTMAAKRLPTILPPLSFEEALEVTKIYSICGALHEENLIQKRPFRSPHHTASAVSIIGGGTIPKPGEVSLAHYGVLFLDELPEFQKHVLEVLRQPMEEGVVHITRANASLSYPADFIFLASMNPCPCGFLGDESHECTCSQQSINRYLGKISSPLLDRIDIHIEVKPTKYDEISSSQKGRSSDEIRNKVLNARKIQSERFKDTAINANGQMNNQLIEKFCCLDDECEKIIEKAFNKYKFSGRTYHKILKVARTIADLDLKEEIEKAHMLEAIRYRTLDTKYWSR